MPEHPFSLPPVSRRTVLGVGLAALADQIAGCKRPTPPSRQDPPTTRRAPEAPVPSLTKGASPDDAVFAAEDPRPRPYGENRIDITEMRFLNQCMGLRERIEYELRTRYGVETPAEADARLGLDERARVRRLVLHAFLEKLPRIVDGCLRQGFDRQIEAYGKLFAIAGCQGVLFSTLRDEAARLGIPVDLAAWRGESYYATRLHDFSPTEAELRLQDIDPRNKPGLSIEDHKTLYAHPGWSKRSNIERFRGLFANTGIRRQAAAADLTLAEYFSLLKAVSRTQAEPDGSDAGRAPETIARGLLRTRREFFRRTLIDRDTSVLVFTGYDPNPLPSGERLHAGFADCTWDGPLDAFDVPAERRQKFGHVPGMEPEQTKTSFLRALRGSRGKTFVSIDTHGSPNLLCVVLGNNDFFPEDIADALIGRVRDTGDPRALDGLVLCLQACHTHDFWHNTLAILKRFKARAAASADPAERRIADFRFPDVVTSSQEDALTTHYWKIGPQLQLRRAALEKDGRLTGQRLLQDIQSASYVANDITFFSGGGASQEYAENAPWVNGGSASA